MKKSVILVVAAVTAVTLFLVGCEKKDTPVISRQDVVVAVFKNGNIDYWQQIAKTVAIECDARGVRPIISFINDDSDADGQLAVVAGLDKLRSYYNIKGVIIAPVFTQDDHRVEKALAEFAGNDIPVIIVDSPIDKDASPLKDIYKAYVGTDNTVAGRQLANDCGITDASTIFAARVAASTPTVERYNGFCDEIGATVPLWETFDLDTPENLKVFLAKYQGRTNLFFFNGNLCNSVKAAFSGVNVYTFDVYEQFLLDLKNPATSPIKGIMAQNTFEMGRQAVSAVFSTTSEKNIYIPAVYITSDNLYSIEVKPFLDYYNIREDVRGSVLMLLGDATTPYWQQVLEGAQKEAEVLGLDVLYEFRASETDCQNILKKIDEAGKIQNLKGIILAESDTEIDKRLADKGLDIPIVAVDATPMIDSPLKDIFSACVVPDNFSLGKELASKTAGSKSIVISYAIGGSSDRADGIIIGKGTDNVKVLKCNTIASAIENLSICLESDPSTYESLILTSGNFVTSELMEIASEYGMSVSCVDMNPVIGDYLQNGDIAFAAVPDTYEMGAEAIRCTLNDKSGYHIHNVTVNYLYPNKRTTLANVKRSIGNSDDKRAITFEYNFSYVDGVFHHTDYTENILGKVLNSSTIYLDGDKILDEDGTIVCENLKFTPDGFISYLESPEYGQYSITYAGRHISSIQMDGFENTQGLAIARTDTFHWKNNNLESIVCETSIGGIASETATLNFSYSNEPNRYRQFSGIMTLCLDNIGVLIPDLACIGYFGDGPRMALNGYSETSSSEISKYVIMQEFNPENRMLSVETKLCTEGSGKDMSEKYEYSYSD